MNPTPSPSSSSPPRAADSCVPLLVLSALLVLLGLVVGFGQWAQPQVGPGVEEVACGPAFWPELPDDEFFSSEPPPGQVQACAYLNGGYGTLALALLVPGLLGLMAPMVVVMLAAVWRRPRT